MRRRRPVDASRREVLRARRRSPTRRGPTRPRRPPRRSVGGGCEPSRRPRGERAAADPSPGRRRPERVPSTMTRLRITPDSLPRRTSHFVERLARRGSAGPQPVRRLGAAPRTARPVPARTRAGVAAARRRGTRLPRHAHLGDPAHLRAAAHRHRAGRGHGDDRAPHARRARDRRRDLALEPRPDASGHGHVEPPADPCGDRGERAVPRRARAGTPGDRRSAGSRTPRSAGCTSATRPTAVRRRSVTGSRSRLRRLSAWRPSRSVATRSCSRPRSPASRGWSSWRSPSRR